MFGAGPRSCLDQPSVSSTESPVPRVGGDSGSSSQGRLAMSSLCCGSLACFRNSRPWFGGGLSEASHDRIPHPIYLY